ncbi:MAG TPA: RNA-binding transcriptional accessory protein [Gammaproteobacteria bacterium]|nr:RNA-binding transcriptional accessory protein [Gammaproteobacteria bacterium]
MNISQIIANELAVAPAQVDAAVTLLDEGATVPFVARYRKEVTQGLDDTQLRQLDVRLTYLRELQERRGVILKSVDEQGKLTDALKAQFLAAETKTDLEDLYLPYKPKRRTKAQMAREAGLEPLADALFDDPTQVPETVAAGYLNVDAGITAAADALEGAKQILMERFAEDPTLTGTLREFLWDNAHLKSEVVAGKEEEGKKFSDYFAYDEAICKVPSHRALALFRGRNEDILYLTLDLPTADAAGPHPCEAMVASHFKLEDQGRAADAWLLQCAAWAWKIKLQTRLDVDLKLRLREAAEDSSMTVFAKNLSALLLAAPAGAMTTIGLDPGIRTGVKVAVIDETGKLLETTTLYPHPPKKQWDASIHALAQLAQRHGAKLVAIGNGTASRETDRLVADLVKQHKTLGLQKIVVSEAGASVYSASEVAAHEFPSLDVSLRGAVSIARRLQDPLAELVKIDPKSIGVGQYQHDVNQTQLGRTLDGVVEDCVNAVGVDVNSASAELLMHVSGLSKTLAENIVQFRNEHGAFKNRKKLLKVPRLGDKTYEQAAGFLRIREGDNALDASAVHPEAYPVVEKIVGAAPWIGIKEVS